MTQVRFFTDEDIYAHVAGRLRSEGVDSISTREISRTGESDESQLTWSAGENRVLVTFNVAHFAQLHSDWLRSGKHHSGIVVSQQIPIGEVIRHSLKLARTLQSGDMQDRLEYLSDWPAH